MTGIMIGMRISIAGVTSMTMPAMIISTMQARIMPTLEVMCVTAQAATACGI